MTALYTRFNTKHANAKNKKAAARCVKQLATASRSGFALLSNHPIKQSHDYSMSSS
ncbi:hypothetical protein HMPREF1582_00915 [Gardnerella vaginalis JCP8151A]|nr:hypothetical protein HMPREF1582_00915 [Gardnerella vaginalis JCP8151A]